MRIGTLLPPDVGTDRDTIDTFVSTAESRGFDHLLSYDHVLGASPDRPGGWDGPYDHTDPFHEPLTTLSYVAGRTEEIDLMTGVLVLPQRQTALVAKQAAELDLLSEGRLRLGIGVGWNHVEYEALGQSFGSRGARIEEQVELLRALWTDELVEFDGEFHSVPDAGINPLPTQRPIPLWMGGAAPPVLDRVGRTADGWLPLGPPNDDRREELAAIREAAAEAGRDPDAVGVHGQLPLDPDRPEQWLQGIEDWAALGATHLTVTTTRAALAPGEHERLVARFADELADAGRSLD